MSAPLFGISHDPFVLLAIPTSCSYQPQTPTSLNTWPTCLKFSFWRSFEPTMLESLKRPFKVLFCLPKPDSAHERICVPAGVPKLHPTIKVSYLDNSHEFWYSLGRTMTTEQKKRLLKAKIAVALQDELGRVPKKEEIDNVFLLARVMYKAVLGLHYKRQEQKKHGQLAIF